MIRAILDAKMLIVYSVGKNILKCSAIRDE